MGIWRSTRPLALQGRWTADRTITIQREGLMVQKKHLAETEEEHLLGLGQATEANCGISFFNEFSVTGFAWKATE